MTQLFVALHELGPGTSRPSAARFPFHALNAPRRSIPPRGLPFAFPLCLVSGCPKVACWCLVGTRPRKHRMDGSGSRYAHREPDSDTHDNAIAARKVQAE